MVKSVILATGLLLAVMGQAQAGEYATGVQIGSAPTAAQAAFHEKQMRIRYQGDFMHESEHRNGIKLVIAVNKHIWKSMGRALRGSMDGWDAPSETHHSYEDEPHVVYE